MCPATSGDVFVLEHFVNFLRNHVTALWPPLLETAAPGGPCHFHCLGPTGSLDRASVRHLGGGAAQRQGRHPYLLAGSYWPIHCSSQTLTNVHLLELALSTHIRFPVKARWHSGIFTVLYWLPGRGRCRWGRRRISFHWPRGRCCWLLEP